MNFCTFCDNMLFIKNKLNDSGEVDVTYYCKYCGNSEKFNSITQYDEDESDIPKNLDHDVTLPRRKNVKCTNNAECDDKDVILLRNDNSSKQYTFYCTGCEKTFTT